MTPVALIHADARRLPLAAESVHCIVTSPPYFGLRDYGGVEAQVGLEAQHDCLGWARGEDCGACFVCTLRVVARECWRVLRDDGTLWLNLGDARVAGRLLGSPWSVALALQADGWTLRSDVVWHQTCPTPESASNRPHRSHEYVFLLTKDARHYYYDADAVRRPHAAKTLTTVGSCRTGRQDSGGKVASGNWAGVPRQIDDRGAHLRDVWSIGGTRYFGAHFATYPPEIVKPCILAGCPPGGVVLDPFAGSGTTGMVARALGRRAILVDCNRDYLDGQARHRILGRTPPPEPEPVDTLPLFSGAAL